MAEKIPNKPLTASEIAEQERLAVERKARGDERAEKEFMEQLKVFVDTAKPDELRKFIAIACKDSPEGQKEFRQLQKYFDTKACEFIKTKTIKKAPEKTQDKISTKPQESIPQRTPEKAPEKPVTPQFDLAPLLKTEKINGNPVQVLSPDIYEAFAEYSSNPDKLLRLVSKDQLLTLAKKKEQAIRGMNEISTYPGSASEYLETQSNNVNALEFDIQREERKILESNKPKLQKLLSSLATDKGRALVENTQIAAYEAGVKGVVRNGLGASPDSQDHPDSPSEKITQEIYNKTVVLAGKISVHSQSLNKEIDRIRKKWSAVPKIILGNTQDARPEREIMQITNTYKELIGKEVKAYGKDVGDYLINLDPTPATILQKKRFTLPIGGKRITLDFSQLGEVNMGDKKALKVAFDKNFEKIYRDTISEKIWDSVKSGAQYAWNNKAEVAVDVGSTVFSGMITASLITITDGTTLLAAGATFTAIDNVIRGAGYGAIGAVKGEDIKQSVYKGLDIKALDAEALRKKGFELANNTVLFGIFRGTEIGEKAFKEAVTSLAGKTLTPELTAKIAKNPIFKGVNIVGTPIIKTGAEALFFTGYIATSNGVNQALEGMIQSGMSKEEALKTVGNEMLKVTNIDTFLDYYAYNLGFITAVKLGNFAGNKVKTKIGEKRMENLHKDLDTQQTIMEQSLNRLEKDGYSFMTRPDGGFFAFDPQGHKADLTDPKFAQFLKSNQAIYMISIRMTPAAMRNEEDIPENGRGGKTATNPTNLEAKYINLKNNSRTAEKEGLKYALQDEAVFSRVEQVGLSDGTGIKEGLLKKSGFEEYEIRDYKEGKLKGADDMQKEALGKMEKAVERVMKEYSSAKILIGKLDSHTISLNEFKIIISEKMGLKGNEVLRLEKIVRKEGK